MLVSCVASTLVTIYVLRVQGQATTSDVFRQLGMWPLDPLDILKILAMLCVLFAGPLFEILIVDASWKELTPSNIKTTFWTSPTSHRNVVVAPCCEELVFRSLVISLYLLAEVPPYRIVFTSPLIFGVAHVHHFVEMITTRTPPGRSFPPPKVCVLGAAVSLFQFIYTTIFGSFVAFVFLRTGNVFAAVAAHTFCNFMGLPRLWGRLGPVEVLGATPDIAQGKPPPRVQTWREVPTISIGWTVAYYALIFLGAYCFYGLVWPMTESSNALIAF